VHNILETIFYSRTNTWQVPLGNNIYILDNRVTESTMVRQNDFLGRKQDYKTKSHKK
jgi:hypothetical protein